MAELRNISTKMIFEYEDSLTGKKTRYTFPYVRENVTEAKFTDIAGALNNLQSKTYSGLFKTEETEIFDA